MQLFAANLGGDQSETFIQSTENLIGCHQRCWEPMRNAHPFNWAFHWLGAISWLVRTYQRPPSIFQSIENFIGSWRLNSTSRQCSCQMLHEKLSFDFNWTDYDICNAFPRLLYFIFHYFFSLSQSALFCIVLFPLPDVSAVSTQPKLAWLAGTLAERCNTSRGPFLRGRGPLLRGRGPFLKLLLQRGTPPKQGPPWRGRKGPCSTTCVWCTPLGATLEKRRLLCNRWIYLGYFLQNKWIYSGYFLENDIYNDLHSCRDIC